MDKTFKLLQCDEPSSITGRIYPREEIEKAVKQFKEEKVDKGIAYGTLDQPRGVELPIADISHRVTDISINDKGEVHATIELLDTPKGLLAQDMMESIDFRLSPCMLGVVDDNQVTSDCTLLQTALVPDNPSLKTTEKDNE